jgi:hypothetical protein
MWGGYYVVDEYFLAQELSKSLLLGISTYINREDIEINHDGNLRDDKEYRKNVKFILKNAALWHKTNVLSEAIDFFNYDKTRSVRYKGFLVNHTQKQEVHLGDYYKKSVSILGNGHSRYAIDAIPALTETGGGVEMALFDGMTFATTEELRAEWCGDLLQIVDALPDGYERLDCCFAGAWARARYCYKKYGVDEEGFVLEQKGKRFLGCDMELSGKRGDESFMRVDIVDGTAKFDAIPIV